LPDLFFGLLLSYTGETDPPCEVVAHVGVTWHAASAFTAEGRRYAPVCVRDLEPGSSYPYTATLAGEVSRL
jgi:hypothetical protein